MMQVDSIISNTITKDIRLKGHQSIRFALDGFSILVSDASYRPVYLKKYTFEPSVTPDQHPSECTRILKESGLLSFEGETVIILDSRAFTVVPEPFFAATSDRSILEKATTLKDSDLVYHRFIKNRNFNVVYAISEEIETLKNSFSGNVNVLHSSECLVSLSDQVKSSDHQRGVIIADVQPFSLDIVVIREDHVHLLNRYSLKDPSEFIYHALNTLNQLQLDRESIPIYLSGIIHEEHELYGLLGKYVRHVNMIPYYLEKLSREEMLSHMILSEGSKCA